MNGSIIYELDRPENAGLSKSVKVLEKVKKELDDVSWADIIAVAGAEAVSTCGGPVIKVKLGRMDARSVLMLLNISDTCEPVRVWNH